MQDNWSDVIQLTLLLLDQLPPGCIFNLTKIGAHYVDLFPCHVEANSTNKNTAREFVLGAKPTESSVCLYKYLDAYLDEKVHLTGQFTSSFVFVSDGLVSNPGMTLKLARQFSYTERILPACVVPQGNKHLMLNLAQVSGGSYQVFDCKAKGKWMAGVGAIVGICLEPGLTQVDLKWKVFGLKQEEIEQSPLAITSLFNKTRQVCVKL